MMHFDCPWCAGEASVVVDDQVGAAKCLECAINVDLAPDPEVEAAARAA